MLKRVLIVLGFVAFFGGCLYMVYSMSGAKNTKIVPLVESKEVKEVNLSLNSYKLEELSEVCDKDDEIFCAIERTVKCTINPNLSICVEGEVPGFVLGKIEDDIRPKNVSFSITKIKPVPDSRDVLVYTKSQCDGSWFGLCSGTVIYFLSAVDGAWKVVNVNALEE